MICDMCTMYPDRIEVVVELGCQRCKDKEEGHHHHILHPIPEFKKEEFDQWKRIKKSHS